MKKHYSAILFAALSLCMPQALMAQTHLQDKTDVFAKALIKQASAAQTNSATGRTADNAVRVLLRATDTETVAQAVEAMGGKANTVADQLLSITVPASGL